MVVLPPLLIPSVPAPPDPLSGATEILLLLLMGCHQTSADLAGGGEDTGWSICKLSNYAPSLDSAFLRQRSNQFVNSTTQLWSGLGSIPQR